MEPAQQRAVQTTVFTHRSISASLLDAQGSVKVVYSSSRLVTLCLSEIQFPASDEFQWGEVVERLVRPHAVVGCLPMTQLPVENGQLIGLRLDLVELFVVSAMGTLDVAVQLG